MLHAIVLLCCLFPTNSIMKSMKNLTIFHFKFDNLNDLKEKQNMVSVLKRQVFWGGLGGCCVIITCKIYTRIVNSTKS